MYYIAVKVPPKYHQMTLEELIYGTSRPALISQNETNTRVYQVEQLSERFLKDFSVAPLLEKLERFNADTEFLRTQNRRDLYYSFVIPKKSGGLRHIDAPERELMDALRRLKNMFEYDFHPQRRETTIQTAYYHSSAFAYIRKRSTIDCVKRHQANESKWFAKLDFSNFFGTTTLDFAMHMLSMIFPFCEICKTEHGREELRKAIELGFLDGVLPQGTPLSPTLTNMIMMPFDYRMANRLRSFYGQRYVYTRYADDLIISSRYWFPVKKIEQMVHEVLREFEAPYRLNTDKTRYGSSSGQNWNLGVMLNKENKITVGNQNKKRFKSMLASYAMDKGHGISWTPEDLQNVLGLYSYYRMVEGDAIERCVAHINSKFNIDVIKTMKAELRPAG